MVEYEVLKMNEANSQKIMALYNQASKERHKGDYRIYNGYKKQVELLLLTPEEYESTMRMIAKLLKV